MKFGELGYAREARASYLDFVAAREAGTLPKRHPLSGLPADAVCGGQLGRRARRAARGRGGLREGDDRRGRGACPAHSAQGSLHPVGRLQRNGDLGRPAERRRARQRLARRDHRPHAAAVRRGSRRRRARPASVLRRFRRQAFRRAEGRGANGRFRQRVGRIDSAQARLYPYAGADRPQRRRVSSPAARSETRRRHRAVSRRGACQRRRRRHQGPHRRGAALRAGLRHRHRMRHGARPHRKKRCARCSKSTPTSAPSD